MLSCEQIPEVAIMLVLVASLARLQALNPKPYEGPRQAKFSSYIKKGAWQRSDLFPAFL